MTSEQPNDSLAIIAECIFTQNQLEFLVKAVQKAQKNLGRGQADTHQPFADLPVQVSHLLTELWQKNTDQDKDLTQFLQNLELMLSKIKFSTLILAYRPTTAQTSEIGRLLRGKLGPNLILKIDYQPQLVAGFVLEHQGKRYDYGLTQQINNYAQQSPS